jgi:hypothetical protein
MFFDWLIVLTALEPYEILKNVGQDVPCPTLIMRGQKLNFAVTTKTRPVTSAPCPAPYGLVEGPTALEVVPSEPDVMDAVGLEKFGWLRTL